MQIVMFFAPDSFRKERSLAWRRAMKRAQARAIVDETARREAEATAAAEAALSPIEGKNEPASIAQASDEKEELPAIKPAVSFRADKIVVEGADGKEQAIPVKLAFQDVNPLSAIGYVIKSPQVFLVTTFSGILYGLTCVSWVSCLADCAQILDRLHSADIVCGSAVRLRRARHRPRLALVRRRQRASRPHRPCSPRR